MELSSLVSRQIPYLSGGGAGINTRSSQPLFPGDVYFQGRKAFGASRLRSRRALNSGFGDNGHVEYYYNSGSTSAAGNHKKVLKEIKKKLKLLEGLAEGLAAQLIQGNPISDSAEALLQQLEQVRAEEKELKKKLEKAKIKSVLMKITNDGDDESSESGEGVTDTNNGVGLDALNNALGLTININGLLTGGTSAEE